MRKKFNGYLTIGLLFNGAYLISNQTKMVPDLIKGVFAGVAIALMCIGIYAENHDMSKCRNRKMQFIKSMINR